jgi:hypothetical protein
MVAQGLVCRVPLYQVAHGGPEEEKVFEVACIAAKVRNITVRETRQSHN